METSGTNKGRYMPGLTKAMMSEAGAWMARLNGPYRTQDAEQGFRRWLRDDPRHVEAFKLVSVDWEGMEELRRFASVTISAPVRVAAATQPAKARSRRLRPLLAAAAVVALAVGSAAFYYVRLAGVETGVGEQRILTLQDGTRVYLNTSTHIVVRYDKGRRHVRLAAGEALFEVARHPGWPFVVTVGDQQVTALGTAFLVRRDRDRVAVTLMEGKVAVTPVASGPAQSAEAPEPVLTPGDRLTFPRSGAAPKRDRPQLTKLVAWQQGKVAIDNMRLADAVAEMNRYSPIGLVIERPESAQLLVSGVFSVGQSASFARAVAQSYGLRVIDEGGTLVLAGLAQQPEEAATR